MMDPMHEALKRRRAKALDLTIVMDAGKPSLDLDESKGDLAPEVKDESLDTPEKLLAEQKAMHAKEGDALQDAVLENEAGSPEHHPLLRGDEKDELGHEQSTQDPELEAFMQKGHEHDTLTRPKTLGARVRAALQSKKGK